MRFDVWQVPDEPDAVYLYEAFVDQAAFDTHKEGAHPFKKFVAEIIPNVIEPVVFVLPFSPRVPCPSPPRDLTTTADPDMLMTSTT